MPDTIRMDEKQLALRLKADERGAPKAIQRAMFSAGQRAKAWIVKETPVDRGILRNAWKVIKLSDGSVEVANDQPYAGIMEMGARPFKVSPEGIWALKGWVMRKLKSGQMFAQGAGVKIGWAKGWKKALLKAKGESLITSKRKVGPKGMDLEKEAERIAWAIAKTFEKVGMKGKYFVMRNLPYLASLMEAEVERYLEKFFGRPLVTNEGK